MSKISFQLGAIAPHIKKQLPQLTDREAQKIEAHRAAINRLRIHSILTRSEAKRAEGRLVKMVFDSLKALE